MAHRTDALDLTVSDVSEPTWEDLARSASSLDVKGPPECIVIGCDGACCCSTS